MFFYQVLGSEELFGPSGRIFQTFTGLPIGALTPPGTFEVSSCTSNLRKLVGGEVPPSRPEARLLFGEGPHTQELGTWDFGTIRYSRRGFVQVYDY